MKPRVEFGNPYKESLLRAVYTQGKRAKLRGLVCARGEGVSNRTQFAFRAGYLGRRWHRSPNGQVKWHKLGG